MWSLTAPQRNDVIHWAAEAVAAWHTISDSIHDVCQEVDCLRGSRKVRYDTAKQQGKRGGVHQETSIPSYRLFGARVSLEVPDHIHSESVGQGDVNPLCKLVEPGAHEHRTVTKCMQDAAKQRLNGAWCKCSPYCGHLSLVERGIIPGVGIRRPC